MKNKFSKFINLQGKYLTSLLILLALSIGQMWGADATTPDYSSYDWTTDQCAAQLGTHGNVVISGVIGTSGGSKISSTHYAFDIKANLDASVSEWTTAGSYLGIASTAGKIDSVRFLWCPNGTNNTYFGWVAWEEGVTPARGNIKNNNYKGVTPGYTASKSWDAAKWETIDFSGIDAYTVYFSRSMRKFRLTGSESDISNFGGGQTINVLGIRVWLHPSGYSITYEENGHGANQTDLTAQTALPATLPTLSEAGWIFGGWFTNSDLADGHEAVAGASISENTTLYAKWTEDASPTHTITYNSASLKGADVSGYPTEYYEGTGIASFDPLPDVTDYHFNGWSPASISADANTDQTISATWVDAYDVTFSAGAGSGTVPASFQKWETATFELPGQGSMVAPSGKAFDGWKANGTGDKLAAGAEYTMGNAAVEFVAQWKAVPQTIYYWQSSYSGSPTMNSAESVTGGTIEWKTDDSGKSWGNGTYNKGSNAVPTDLQVASGKKAVTNGGNALYAELTLSGTEKFQEGDTIYVGGYYKWMFSTSKQRYEAGEPTDDAGKQMSGDIANIDTKSTSSSSYNYEYAIIPAGVNVSTIYLMRGQGNTSGLSAIKVIRPAERTVISTDYDLTAVKINGDAISASDLATLKTADAYLLDLSDPYVSAPIVKFARRTTVTYDEGAPKVTNDTITVTATEVSGKWQAQGTINGITYTVKMVKPVSYTVSYYDGASLLGTETVEKDASPTEFSAKQEKTHYEFVSWKNNADDVITPASLVVTKDTALYGTWSPLYAGDIDFTSYVANPRLADALSKVFVDDNHNYTCGGSFSNSQWGQSDEDAAYQGYKFKDNGVWIEFLLQANKRATLFFGNYAAAMKVKIGSAAAVDATLTNSQYVINTDDDVIVRFTTSSGGTVTLKAITITDKPAKSDDVSLATLSYTLGSASSVNIPIEGGKLTYNVEVPYKTTLVPVVAAMANDANVEEFTITQASTTEGSATIYVKAEDNSTEATYTINFSIAPKDMLCLIKATHTAATTATVEGYIGGAYDKDTQSGGKIGSNDQYFGVKLAEGTFQAGDVVKIHASNPSAKVQIFSDKGVNMLDDGLFDENDYTFTLTSSTEWIYLYRTSTAGSDMNPTLGYIAVYRPFAKPVLTAIDIDGAKDNSVNQTSKTITLAIPALSDLAALTVSPTIWSNDPSLTTAEVTSNAGEWVLGANTYVLTDKDGDTESYTINLSRAASIKEVQITGATSVMVGNTITLSAEVIDSDNNPASVQDVVWSVKAGDESLASVSSTGVVTGKAVGTAHIIATSVADGSKSAEKAVTIDAFVGTRYAYWFVNTDDIPSDLANDDGAIFEGAPATTSSNLSASMTVEINGVDRIFDVTRRSGDVGFGTFHVPAGCTADLYVLAVGSGSPRTLKLKETTTGVVYQSTPDEFGSSAVTLVFSNVASGNYTFDKGGQNSRVALMVAVLNSYPVTAVSLATPISLRTEQTTTPVMTLTHPKAAVTEQTWSILTNTATGTSINSSTGLITAGTTPGEVTVQVVVKDAFNNTITSNVCTINVVEIFDRIDVTGNTTWDWNSASNSENVKVVDATGVALANYIAGAEWQKISGTDGDFAYNTNADGSYQGYGSLSFNTTVPGFVKITGRRISNDAELVINGTKVVGTLTSSKKTYDPVCVPVGEVTITPDANGMRLTKVEFIAAQNMRALTPGRMGTFTTAYDVKLFHGADFYVPNQPTAIGIEFISVDELKAGYPYFFVANDNALIVVNEGAEATVAESDLSLTRGMVGYLGSGIVNVPDDGNSVVVIQNHLYTSNNNQMASGYAYFDMSVIQTLTPINTSSGAPRRRLVVGYGAPEVTTDIDNLNASEKPVKLLIDGQLFIIRGEKMYDATGRLVK